MRRRSLPSRDRWIALGMLFPVVVVSGIWIYSGFRDSPLAPPTPGSWRWRLTPNYIRIETVSQTVPANQAPHHVGASRHGGRPVYGLHFSSDFGGGSFFFGWFSDSRGYYLHGRHVAPARVLSISMIVPLLATLPFAWGAALYWQRSRLADLRRKHQQCEVCGYDLRATPIRCPECGTIVTSDAPPTPA